MSLTKAINQALKEEGEPTSELERAMLTHIRQVGLPEPAREYQFISDRRKWAFDFAWPTHKVALEVEGMGADGYGRHQRPEGFTEDCRKYSRAAGMGWRIVRVTAGMIHSGEAVDLLTEALYYGHE